MLAKWFAGTTPLIKPNCGEGFFSTKPRPKSVYDFLGLLYCFIGLIVCLSCHPGPFHNIYFILMARYSLFVLKVPLNTNKPNQTATNGCDQILVSKSRSAKTRYLVDRKCMQREKPWWKVLDTTYSAIELHGDGQDGNPVDSKGIPQNGNEMWKWRRCKLRLLLC